MIEKRKTIAAIIPTFNRKYFLDRCIGGIINQVKKVNEIIIIDNGSTDNTESYLREKYDIDSKFFRYIRLEFNGGGSGGVSLGCKEGYARGFDYVWIFDDDSFPDPNALDRLLPFCEKYLLLSCIAVDEVGKNKLIAPLCYRGKEINTLSDINVQYDSLVFDGVVRVWSGTLISRNIFETVHFPESKYFIWGEESEFIRRIKRNNIPFASVGNAIIYHRIMEKQVTIRILGRYGTVMDSSPLRTYCYYRNFFEILLKYRGRFILMCWCGIEILKRLLLCDVRNLKIIFAGWFDAYHNIWNGHQRYISKRSD